MTTNFTKIKNMSVEEMAIILNCNACATCAFNGFFRNCIKYGCKKGIIQWLNSEVEE